MFEWRRITSSKIEKEDLLWSFLLCFVWDYGSIYKKKCRFYPSDMNDGKWKTKLITFSFPKDLSFYLQENALFMSMYGIILELLDLHS